MENTQSDLKPRPRCGRKSHGQRPMLAKNARCRIVDATMGLSTTTQKVIELVEEKTGFPVHVEPDSSLHPSQLAKVVIARGDLHLHRVLYRPDNNAPDYLICQQCGFI